MAKALASAGAKKVYILGRRKSALEKAAAQHKSFAPIECDVTSKNSLQSAVEAITKETGYVNLVVANSGIYGPAKSFDPSLTVQQLRKNLFEDVAMEDFTATFHANVTGAYFTLLAFLELLDAGEFPSILGAWVQARREREPQLSQIQGGFGAPLKEGSNVPSIPSQVIITSSVSAYTRDRFTAPAYGGSKSAIAHLMKHASTNLAPYEIRVNAMAPGCKLQQPVDDMAHIH
ncbi:MCM DNA helicase complex subunit [Diatrype stigma]|uniref:MCM DNA helicase complex subunit n=1 Tax=Diatrype stigma TaxID=117547 RepID=A0AAN9UAZ9_9PEZI